LISTEQFFTSHISAFRGHRETLSLDTPQNSGNLTLLDCTRDAGGVEQMTIILRYIDTETGFIKEHSVRFIAVQETTAD
jgi:hypothetical protein